MSESSRIQWLMPLLFFVIGLIIAAVGWALLGLSILDYLGITDEVLANTSPLLISLFAIPNAILIALVGVSIGNAMYCLASIVWRGWTVNDAIRAHFKDRPITEWDQPVAREQTGNPK